MFINHNFKSDGENQNTVLSPMQESFDETDAMIDIFKKGDFSLYPFKNFSNQVFSFFMSLVSGDPAGEQQHQKIREALLATLGMWNQYFEIRQAILNGLEIVDFKPYAEIKKVLEDLLAHEEHSLLIDAAEKLLKQITEDTNS